MNVYNSVYWFPFLLYIQHKQPSQLYTHKLQLLNVIYRYLQYTNKNMLFINKTDERSEMILQRNAYHFLSTYNN